MNAAQVDKLLATAGSIPIPPKGMHWRVHDDHDGTFTGEIVVFVAEDGDVHVGMDRQPPIRFRNPLGGGNSPRTHQALLMLAHAIALDNADRPQRSQTPK